MATTTMTPLDAIAYLHGTLPKRPELYEDDEYTAALIALGPLVAAQPESPARVRRDGEEPTHQHCDGDPIECSVQGMQGEWEEAKRQRDYWHDAAEAFHAQRGDLAADLAATVERLGDAELGQAAALARAEEAERKLAQVRSDEAQPAEPLFTGEYLGVWDVPGLERHARINTNADAAAEGDLIYQQVDVYPHGSRPAPRKVTAELTAEDMENARSKIRLYGKPHDGDYFMFLLVNLNAILASKAGA